MVTSGMAAPEHVMLSEMSQSTRDRDLGLAEPRHQAIVACNVSSV